MKNQILLLLFIIILVSNSCKKNYNNPTPQGRWSFMSSTYNVTAGANIGTQFNVSSGTNNNVKSYGELNLSFGDTVFYPTPAGIYTVVKYPPSAHQVSIWATTGGDSAIQYDATGSNGLQTVSVTISNGKEMVSGSGIILRQVTNGDSAPVSFNLWCSISQ
jgi:hypothetical protein